MPVFANAIVEKFSLPGLAHQTLASHAQGVNGMEVWMQTIAPGAATPVRVTTAEGEPIPLSWQA